MTVKQLLNYVGAALFGVIFISWAVPSMGVQMIIPILFLVLLIAWRLNPAADLLIFLIAVAAAALAFFVPVIQLPGDPRVLEIYMALLILGVSK
jgi:hypothetical protein